MTVLKDFALQQRYTLKEGVTIMTGVQALVRLPIDQHVADKRAGLNTATFISGYRGSPVGTVDLLLDSERELLKDHQIVFQPGVNEDLAVTAVMGSQMAQLLPDPKYDGVLGMWYGKAPGVDRSGDAFKHANIVGLGRNGGVLAIAGDDPIAKSSTVPSHSEISLFDNHMPVFYPGNVQEVLDLGRYGFELSRYSGLWTGMKFVTNVADEYSAVEVHPERIVIQRPDFEYRGRPWQSIQDPRLLAPFSLDQERDIFAGRLEAAKHFARLHPINQVVSAAKDAWLGLVAAGKTYYDLREALVQMGLDDEALERYGIRLLKLGLLYPLPDETIKDFAVGLEDIIVLEEKRAFIELFIKDSLYGLTSRPRVQGKRDHQGQVFVPTERELDADIIASLLRPRLEAKLPPNSLKPAAGQSFTDAPVMLTMVDAEANRTPYFCSGCPHNRSTVVPEGSLQGGGIGCHTMAMLMDREVLGLTQMGGEGAQWVGMSPFTNTEHLFQNLGDGTLFHSGSLAIRQALAAEVNITYKILYNSAVAMTGGQVADGAMPVPELTRFLEAEGVKEIIVVADEPDKYENVRWAKNVKVWERGRLDEAQRHLREVSGVTAIIYDQACAADLRRKRSRGLAPDPKMRVIINEAVCEGCGDCGVKSNCLSVMPVETEFGRKTQIHQGSCNKDYTCLEGDCPAFVTVLPEEDRVRERPALELADSFPDPLRLVPDEANIYIMGIGGTGVLTVNQILATAAVLEGKHASSLDQTGLSQKGGPVTSHLKFRASVRHESNKIATAQADAYIVFDILSATTDANLSHAHKAKTVAVVSSSEVPTGAMVSHIDIAFPEGQLLKKRIEAVSRAKDNVYFDAVALSEHLFGSHMPANILTIGAAYQAGVIPLSSEAIEAAIRLNGVAVATNIQAFRVGRKVVADPQWQPLETALVSDAGQVTLSNEARLLIQQVDASGELLRLLNIRVPELIAYQNKAYAERYVDVVREIKQQEQTIFKGQSYRLSEAVARYLFKLMAYKDEYEVARLSLKDGFQAKLRAEFGEQARFHYRLHPPFLRAMGLKKKLALGQWFNPVYRLLYGMRFLRHTAFDIFGYAKVRRVERQLIADYQRLIKQELEALSPANYERAVQLAELPDMIRGYEEIKLANVEAFWDAVKDLRVTKDALAA